MLNFLKNALEIFGIVYLRFRFVPRVWCVWLVAVNAACLFFITHVEAQVVLAVTGAAVAAQALIYDRIGFTRILGIVHVMWIPMFAWMATRIDAIQADPLLASWLSVLFATNLVSLFVDTGDAARYLRGEKAPHYSWHNPQAV